MNLEDLRPGVSVTSRDGHKLGTLSRFVITKDSHRLTHIVVDTGILRSGEALWKGGWGLNHDRVIPVGVLEHADSDEVRLTMTAEEFRDLSVDYIEEGFRHIPDDMPGRPDSSDLQRLARSIPGEPGPFFVYETVATPPGEIDIKKDSPVWRLSPHEKIGEVEGLTFDEDTGKVQSLVLHRGRIFGKKLVLPLDYVVEVVADIVRVDITDDELKRLQEYQPQD